MGPDGRDFDRRVASDVGAAGQNNASAQTQKAARGRPFWKSSSGFGGAGEGTRTPDPIITNDVLYQLSYTGQPNLRRD